MKYLYAVLVGALVSISISSSAQNVALTPPMGWNSYNCFGSAVHEDEVKANADYVAKNLKQVGWQYIVVDFLWSYDNPPGSNIGNPFQLRLPDGSYVPWLTMDKWGRLSPQPTKFPSAFGGKGFGPLAEYVHGLGLKVWYPRYAWHTAAGGLSKIAGEGSKRHHCRYDCRHQFKMPLDEPHVRAKYEKARRPGVFKLDTGAIRRMGC